MIRLRPNQSVREEITIAVTLRFGPADLRRCRFAVSPAFETLSAIRLTSRQESPGHHQHWLDSIRPQLDSLDLRQPRRGYTVTTFISGSQ